MIAPIWPDVLQLVAGGYSDEAWEEIRKHERSGQSKTVTGPPSSRAFFHALICGGARRSGLQLCGDNLFAKGGPSDLVLKSALLFAELMLWGKEQGYQWFNLGMAPFAVLDYGPFSPTWDRLGAFLFEHGEPFYNFQGIRAYKEKFAPE